MGLGRPALAAMSLVLVAAKPLSANSSLAARRISSLLRSRMLLMVDAVPRVWPLAAPGLGGRLRMVAPRSQAAQGGDFELDCGPLNPLESGKHGRKQSSGIDRRYRHGTRRCLGNDQGRGKKDRRGAGR
ncbi:exported protein of unknown function [Pseudomonas sp. JV241A]|nr:exported protein of unknown function [Pseudomonas sp. JV241A]